MKMEKHHILHLGANTFFTVLPLMWRRCWLNGCFKGSNFNGQNYAHSLQLHPMKEKQGNPTQSIHSESLKEVKKVCLLTTFQFFLRFSCHFFLFMPMLSSLQSLWLQKRLEHIKTCCEWGLILFRLFVRLIGWDQMPCFQVGVSSRYSFRAFRWFSSLYFLPAFQRP